MVGSINRRQLKAAVFILILAGVALAKAQPIPGATFTPSRVKPWLQDALSQLAQLPEGTNSVKIASERLTLSYIDPLRATQLLALHGYTIGKPDTPVNSTNLPVVVALVGTVYTDTVPALATKFPQTEADPTNELVVFHDENDPSQLGGVIATVRNDIDLPARQMIIEAMILEVSSTALMEMGVKWNRVAGDSDSDNLVDTKLSSLTIGSLSYPAKDEALNLVTKGGQHGLIKNISAQIKALVRDGEAEILSRPSVLALDNRMAYISVAEDIPIARTQFAAGNNYLNTSFSKEKAGITLALRPRIDARGTEVSMQVNAEVTAKVPDADVEVKNAVGTVLASSPTISRREVKTYVRVANNTPFIIGGLIAKDKQSTVDKVPFLGDIPLLGALFRSKKQEAMKREVIIVLTPFVLPEEHVIGKNMPKDEDAFDSVDNQLFRNAYRIRAEDTFDLNYLYENKQLQRMKALANRIIATDVKLASEYPYSQFVDKAVPGEAILCYRQIYEVLKRRDEQSKLNSSKFIFFEPDRNIGSGHQVQFLEEYIRKNAPEVLTEKGGSKAVLLTFDMKRDSDDAKSIFNEPVPQVKLVDCADRKDWSRQLWELNQPKEKGIRYAVLLREKKDIERLKYAVLMKKTVELNTEELVLTLSSFTRGRLLLMPRVKEQDVELIDGDVARAFFYSEMYYQALQKEMEKDLAAFRKVIEEKDHLKKLVNP